MDTGIHCFCWKNMKFHLHLSLYPSSPLSLPLTLSLSYSLSIPFPLSLSLSHSLTHTRLHYYIPSMPLNGNAFVNAETVIYLTTISTFSLRLIFSTRPKNQYFLVNSLYFAHIVPDLHDVITDERSHW